MTPARRRRNGTRKADVAAMKYLPRASNDCDMLASGKQLRQPGGMSRSPAAQVATPLVRAFSREIARVGGLLSPDFLSSGMSLGEARCLYELGHGDGLERAAPGRRLDLDLGYVSRAVSRLAARRLVTKRVAASDARARSVVVTRKGRGL